MLGGPFPGTRRSRTATLAAALALASLLAATGANATGAGKTRLLVKFAPTVSTQARGATLVGVNAQKVGTISGIGVDVVTVPSTAAANSLARLKGTPGVQFAELDAVRKPQETLPSDPSFPQQFAVGGGAWGWYKTHTTQAWGITKGSPSVVIAILDTGLKTAGLGRLLGPGRSRLERAQRLLRHV